MIYAPYMFPPKCYKINYVSKFHTERKILMKKRTKLFFKSPLSLSVQSKLVSIERDLLSSHQKEKMFQESLAVTKIKSDFKYFLRYTNKFSVCASEIGPLYDKKGNLLTSDKLEMCAILLEQFNSVFRTPLPNKQVIDPDVFFSVESIAYQDDELFLTDITITESIIIDSIRELSCNSAAGLDGIPGSLLLNCAHELAPSFLILFKQSLSSGVIDPSLKKADIVPVF